MEIGRLPKLNSHETATFFHAEIVCRYGVPTAVRSDRGTEYAGRFQRYLDLMGVRHRYIATMNPRANGQVERMVRSVKAAIRRFTAHCKDGQWWEFLPDIARGLRVLPTRATGFSPHVLVFK